MSHDDFHLHQLIRYLLHQAKLLPVDSTTDAIQSFTTLTAALGTDQQHIDLVQHQIHTLVVSWHLSELESDRVLRHLKLFCANLVTKLNQDRHQNVGDNALSGGGLLRASATDEPVAQLVKHDNQTKQLTKLRYNSPCTTRAR